MAPSADLSDLPPEVLTHVCRHLGFRDLIRVSQSCKRFRRGGLETVELPTDSPVVTALRKHAFPGLELVPRTGPIGCTESWVAYLARCARQRRCRERPPIAVGNQHSLFLNAAGRLLTCGQGAAVGHGDAEAIDADPTPVAALTGVRVRSVAAGSYHSLALGWDGRVYSWGHSAHGGLGHGDTLTKPAPVLVEGLESVCGVAAAYHHSFAVTQSGAVFSWGHALLTQEREQHSLRPIVVEEFGEMRVRRVCAGPFIAFAIGEAGELLSWARGNFGRLGHGDRQQQSSPKCVEALRDVRMNSVAVGLLHALALTEEGLVLGNAWAQNEKRALLGSPDVEEELLPKPVEALRGVRVGSVAAAGDCSYAVADTGQLWVWEYELDQKRSTPLGRSGPMSCPLPELVELPRGVKVDAMAGHYYHTLALADDEKVYAWGSLEATGRGALGLGSSVQASCKHVRKPRRVLSLRAACGGEWSAGGLPWSMISSAYFETSRMAPSADLSDLPPEVLTNVCRHLGLRDLIRVSQSCKRFRRGGLETVELPTESPVVAVLRKLSFPQDELVPRTPPIACSESWVAYLARCARQRRCLEAPSIAVGECHSLFLDSSGRLLSCGYGAAVGYGIKGAHYVEPRPVGALADVWVRSVAAGSIHSLALGWDGRVYSWGINVYGDLGHGDRLNRLSPVLVEGLEGVCSIASGVFHNFAVTQPRAVFSWGRAPFYGQEDSLRPILVNGFGEVRVQRVCAGDRSAFAIGEAGELFSWGRCYYRLLGHGDEQHQPSPKRVEALRGIRMSTLSIGYDHALALAEDGMVYAWGENRQRAVLGNPNVERELLPKPIEALRGVRVASVAAADNRSYALADTGELLAWGAGSIPFATPVGHTELTNCPLPIPIKSLGDVKVDAVAAGEGHTLAQAEDGTVYAWGTKEVAETGALGLGMSVCRRQGCHGFLVLTPQRVTALHTWLAGE
jgi:alpha-tubulin suppressor-like RCC1 family protein